MKRTDRTLALAPWVFTIGFFLVWEFACRVLGDLALRPAGAERGARGDLGIPHPARLSRLPHALDDARGLRARGGFGLLLGMALGASRIVNAGSYPLLVGFNSIPKVAVVPILVFWFGVGWLPPVLTAFLISFFPVVVNVATGISTIEPETEDVLRALGASKRDIILKVGVPRAMPYFFGSLKVAITLAYVGR
jgi:NitT/TauT family transport system permease protein